MRFVSVSLYADRSALHLPKKVRIQKEYTRTRMNWSVISAISSFLCSFEQIATHSVLSTKIVCVYQQICVFEWDNHLNQEWKMRRRFMNTKNSQFIFFRCHPKIINTCHRCVLAFLFSFGACFVATTIANDSSTLWKVRRCSHCSYRRETAYMTPKSRLQLLRSTPTLHSHESPFIICRQCHQSVSCSSVESSADSTWNKYTRIWVVNRNSIPRRPHCSINWIVCSIVACITHKHLTSPHLNWVRSEHAGWWHRPMIVRWIEIGFIISLLLDV